MRIDYSEPKQSYVTGQIKTRPRKEPDRFYGSMFIVAIISVFFIGFGTGWFFSQKSAKKAFMAAMEQSSLESFPLPKQTSKSQPTPDVSSSQPQPQPHPPAAATQSAAEPQLSFYKSLPEGNRGNVIGSGINNRNETKAPIQAAIPSNVAARNSDRAQGADTPQKQSKESANDSSFSVQTGSYTVKPEAEENRDKLAAKGYNAYIVEFNQREKGVWYRVRVGKKMEKEVARELAARIGKGAVVVADRE